MTDWPTWNQSIEKRRTMNALPPPPVAWRIDPLDRGIKSYESQPVTSLPQQRDIWVKEGWDVEPLYTAEAVEQAIEPLRQRIAELEAQQPSIDEVMAQVQVFASAWSLVGGRLDNGSMLDQSKIAKAELRAMLATKEKS
jgi:hypothetical protein